MAKYLFGILTALSLMACQSWQPLYKQVPQSGYQKFAQINISPSYNILGQKLYNSLLDRQASLDSKKPQYILNFGVKKSTRASSNFVDGSASAIRATYLADYTLKKGDKNTLFQSRTSTNYSTDNSPYNNELLANKADEQAMNVLADSIAKRLNLFFKQNPNW